MVPEADCLVETLREFDSATIPQGKSRGLASRLGNVCIGILEA